VINIKLDHDRACRLALRDEVGPTPPPTRPARVSPRPARGTAPTPSAASPVRGSLQGARRVVSNEAFSSTPVSRRLPHAVGAPSLPTSAPKGGQRLTRRSDPIGAPVPKLKGSQSAAALPINTSGAHVLERRWRAERVTRDAETSRLWQQDMPAANLAGQAISAHLRPLQLARRQRTALQEEEWEGRLAVVASQHWEWIQKANDSTKRQHQSQFRNFFENEEDSRRVVTLAETEARVMTTHYASVTTLAATSSPVGTDDASLSIQDPGCTLVLLGRLQSKSRLFLEAEECAERGLNHTAAALGFTHNDTAMPIGMLAAVESLTRRAILEEEIFRSCQITSPFRPSEPRCSSLEVSAAIDIQRVTRGWLDRRRGQRLRALWDAQVTAHRPGTPLEMCRTDGGLDFWQPSLSGSRLAAQTTDSTPLDGESSVSHPVGTTPRCGSADGSDP